MPLSIPIDYKAFYKESPAALFECKPDNKWSVVKANKTFYDIIGYTEDSFLSVCDNSFISIVSKEDSLSSLKKDFESYLRSYRNDHQSMPMLSKVTVKRHDHSHISIYVLVKLIEDEHERLACVFLPSFDEHDPIIVDPVPVKTDAVKEELARRKAEKDSKSAMFAGKRILFAEDHPLNAKMLSKMLEESGFEVSIAQNGQRAVELFEKNLEGHFFAVLMDTQMPLLNGQDAAQMIRANEEKRGFGSKVPIIAMVSSKDPIAKQDALPDCFDDSVIKPIGASKLFDKLSLYL